MVKDEAILEISEDGVFFYHLNEKERERVLRELRKNGLDFEVKVVWCG